MEATASPMDWAAKDPALQLPHRRKMQILVAILLGLFLAALDQTIVGTALIARLFQLTQPSLMQLGWFAAAYAKVMPWKDATTTWVRTSWPWRAGRLVELQVKHELHTVWRNLRPDLDALLMRIRALFSR